MSSVLVYAKSGSVMKLGNHLKRCRFDKDNMTQETLAKAIGVSRQTIISIETRRFMPSTLLAIRLAAFFHKPLEEIFFIDENSE